MAFPSGPDKHIPETIANLENNTGEQAETPSSHVSQSQSELGMEIEGNLKVIWTQDSACVLCNV